MKSEYAIVATFTDANTDESPHTDRVPYYHVIQIDPNDELNYQILETFDTFEEAQKHLSFLENTTPCGEEEP